DQDYDAQGRVREQRRYSDADATTLVATSDYTYDYAGRLTELLHTPADDDPIDYTWEYDSEGQLTSQSDHGVTVDYEYDAQGQLTQAGEDSWDYSGNGNRTGDAYHYENDDTNQLTGYDVTEY